MTPPVSPVHRDLLHPQHHSAGLHNPFFSLVQDLLCAHWFHDRVEVHLSADPTFPAATDRALTPSSRPKIARSFTRIRPFSVSCGNPPTAKTPQCCCGGCCAPLFSKVRALIKPPVLVSHRVRQCAIDRRHCCTQPKVASRGPSRLEDQAQVREQAALCVPSRRRCTVSWDCTSRTCRARRACGRRILSSLPSPVLRALNLQGNSSWPNLSNATAAPSALVTLGSTTIQPCGTPPWRSRHHCVTAVSQPCNSFPNCRSHQS